MNNIIPVIEVIVYISYSNFLTQQLRKKMVLEMMTLGDVYKAKRCELNLSVKEVESATSIRATYIEAIETGIGLETLSYVYIQGFMRQYATFLGLDLVSLEREYKDSFKPSQAEPFPKEFNYGIGSIEMRAGTLQGSFWRSNNIIWGASFIAIFAVAFMLIKLLGIF